MSEWVDGWFMFEGKVSVSNLCVTLNLRYIFFFLFSFSYSTDLAIESWAN